MYVRKRGIIMKKLKKSLCLLLGICTLLQSWVLAPSTPSFARVRKSNEIAEEETSLVGATTVVKDGVIFKYKFHDVKKTKIDILKIEKAKKELTIPSKLDGYPVHLTVGPGSDSGVKKIKIENGIKELDEGFAGNKKLESVYIPKSVKIIYSLCFSRCTKLKKVKFRNPSIQIDTMAFNECHNLKEISFPKGEFKGRIETFAFRECNLKKINLPYMKKMKYNIGPLAFAENKNLKQVTFSSRIKNVFLRAGCFSDCPKVQIIVGKQVKTFSSEVQAKSGTVRLLGSQTRLTGFKKPKGRTYYYIQFKKFIVPKNSKALKILRNAEYGTVRETWKRGYVDDPYYYFSTSEADMHKVKVVIK